MSEQPVTDAALPEFALRQSVVLSIGELAVPLTAFEKLAEAGSTRDLGDPSTTGSPSSAPETDPDDSDFYGL
ncbi:MAG TPA: hypothetical protein VLG11_03250 [Candidatus Saccharimonadales bacterium]|nr:hypothetical protein [Candidatus Saccharimonadales bacterium]